MLNAPNELQYALCSSYSEVCQYENSTSPGYLEVHRILELGITECHQRSIDNSVVQSLTPDDGAERLLAKVFPLDRQYYVNTHLLSFMPVDHGRAVHTQIRSRRVGLKEFCGDRASAEAVGSLSSVQTVRFLWHHVSATQSLWVQVRLCSIVLEI